MKRETKREGQLFQHQSERGAALVTVLLLSTLLLSAGLTLIVSTSLSATTSVDATAEMQAYFGAEAGIEATLNVLRGNVAPDASLAGTKMNFRNAANPPTSDKSSDTLKSGNSAAARLSGWLSYSYQSSSTTNDWRVPLTSNYVPLTGIAYNIVISDPDDQGPIATRKITTDPSYQPSRLLIQSVGYGPKGAIKRLETIVRDSSFDFSAPATITMIGADAGTPINFTTGNSAAKTYSGHDHSGTGVLPTFAATSAGDMAVEIAACNKNTVASPVAATIASSSLPTWLQSADQARAFLAEQKANAIDQGRYFTSLNGSSGSTSSPAFTFVDGDANLDGGAGLLIITGNLEMKGNPSFDGLILVLGGGTVNRDGGGNGNIYGAMLVARFDLVGPGGFLAPTFDTNGGGNSTMQYDSVRVGQALAATGVRVIGVREY